MSDLIDREAAIKALTEAYEDIDAAFILQKLPSAQVELSFEIHDIIDYLNSALHPIVSPEHWNVYSELHDMILKLLPLRPASQWIPVRERLPESEDYVLCCTQKKNGGRDVVKGYYSTALGRWVSGMNSNVIAWMPLPEVYKGD